MTWCVAIGCGESLSCEQCNLYLCNMSLLLETFLLQFNIHASMVCFLSLIRWAPPMVLILLMDVGRVVQCKASAALHVLGPSYTGAYAISPSKSSGKMPKTSTFDDSDDRMLQHCSPFFPPVYKYCAILNRWAPRALKKKKRRMLYIP